MILWSKFERMKKFKKYLGGTLITSVILLAGIAYFFGSFDPATNTNYDGLGRQLYEAPWWAYYLGGGYHWSGLYWHIIDLVAFWGGIIAGISLLDGSE